MATNTIYVINDQCLIEINGTQEELDNINSGYKYYVELVNPLTRERLYCQGNDNDIMQQIASSSSSGSGGSSVK